VRLLTIHGAKGLEAEAVLLLDTDTPERSADTMGVLVDWPGEAEWPQKFVFLASETQPPACAIPALDAERLERQREELNALYVALTRARHTLAISSIEPYRAAERSWWQRLLTLSSVVTVPEQTDPAASPAPLESPVFYLKELPPAPVKAALNGLKKDATDQRSEPKAAEDSPTARIGKAMHRLLEWGDASSNNTAAVVREFVLSPEQGSTAAAMAERILRGEGAWAWAPDVVGWQGNEVELMYQGKSLRLDRLVQRKDAGHAGHWWVLDYKSADTPQDQPDLVAQLGAYRDAVQAIYPNEVVNAAFLTGQGKLHLHPLPSYAAETNNEK
jgi:ATP-dependent helicase/nuclease subunit A